MADPISKTEKTTSRTAGSATPGVVEPKGVPSQADGEKAVTLTMAQLDELIAKRVGAALDAAGLANVKPEKQSTVPRPTLEQAKAMVETDLRRGLPVQGVLTTEGWYCHPMAGYIAPPAGNVS